MNKPNNPDEIWLGKSDYSWWVDFKVNGWLFLAAIASGASDILFRKSVELWPLGLKLAAILVPFAALILWARSIIRWIGGMDELHRRITMSAVLFSVSASFFVVMLWHRLAVGGILPSSPGVSWDIGTVAHVFLLMTFFYFLGYFLVNRRYQ
jgi:hypothetical protein